MKLQLDYRNDCVYSSLLKVVKIIVIGTIIVEGYLIRNYYHSSLKYLSPFQMIYFFFNCNLNLLCIFNVRQMSDCSDLVFCRHSRV